MMTTQSFLAFAILAVALAVPFPSAAAPAAPTATIDTAAHTASIGNEHVRLVIDWTDGVRLSHFEDVVAGIDWIPGPPRTPPGPGPEGMREGLIWKQDDIWPDLAPASREFLLTYSPGSDLDAAQEAAAKAIRLTGAAACRLVPSESRATVEGDLARLHLVFAIDGHPIAVGLHAEARAGVNAIRRWTSVRNTGTAPWLLHRLTTAAMMLRPGPDDLELHWVEACTHPSMGPRSPTRWRQATRHRELLGPATLRTLRSDAATRRADGRSSGCMAWLALRDPGSDGGLFAGWEWSGLFDAEVGDFDTESGAGAFGLRMGFSDEGSYARQVAPGETFTTPRAFFGFFAGDAEEAGRATRKVKAAGMKFGLWMGFGQAHADAAIVREHPEFLVTRNGNPVTGGWGMRSLCFSSISTTGRRRWAEPISATCSGVIRCCSATTTIPPPSAAPPTASPICFPPHAPTATCGPSAAARRPPPTPGGRPASATASSS